MSEPRAQPTSPPEATRDQLNVDDGDDHEEPVVFSPEEEANLLAESNERKAEANTLFTSKRYNDAIAKYDEALSACPHYLDYELALLKCNISACHLKLEEWKDAIKSASAAIDGLSRLEAKEAEKEAKEKATKEAEEEDVEEEIVSIGATKAAPAPKNDVTEDPRAKRREDIKRIRAKALMRRARARSEEGGWQNLAGAEEDYKLLNAMDNLGDVDRKIVKAQLRALPPRVKEAQERETAEMWGKLKELGNGILKPFGLSTDNFQMNKDEKTGGYSMSFNQGAPKS